MGPAPCKLECDEYCSFFVNGVEPGFTRFVGGEGGIRTHGGFAPTPDFESGTFDHSATSPARAIVWINRDVAGYTLVKGVILAETGL